MCFNDCFGRKSKIVNLQSSGTEINLQEIDSQCEELSAQKDLTYQIDPSLSCSGISNSELGYSESMNYLLEKSIVDKARKRSRTISFHQTRVSLKGTSSSNFELQPYERHSHGRLLENNKLGMTGPKDKEGRHREGTLYGSYRVCKKKGETKDLSSLLPRVRSQACLDFFDRIETHTQRSHSQRVLISKPNKEIKFDEIAKIKEIEGKSTYNRPFTKEVEDKTPLICSKLVKVKEEEIMEDQEDLVQKRSIITSNYVYALTQQEDSQLFLSATAITGKDFRQVVAHLEKDQEKVFSNLSTSLKQILSYEVNFNFFLSYYQALDNTSSAQLLSALDFEPFIKLLPSSEAFLILLKELKSDNHREIIFAKLNKCSTWRTFLATNKGRNLIIFIFTNFLKRKPFIEKHLEEKLFSLFYEHFVEFSLSKNSTFMIQAFIEHFPSQVLLDKVLYNISNLAFNRNGVFTLICALKAFNNMNLIKRILNMAEVLCTEKYASTLIEKVFSMYGSQAVEYFLKTKKDHLLNIIEDRCGNYIIQKVLGLAFEKDSIKGCFLELVLSLRKVIPRIQKDKVKYKWKEIIIDFERKIKEAKMERGGEEANNEWKQREPKLKEKTGLIYGKNKQVFNKETKNKDGGRKENTNSSCIDSHKEGELVFFNMGEEKWEKENDFLPVEESKKTKKESKKESRKESKKESRKKSKKESKKESRKNSRKKSKKESTKIKEKEKRDQKKFSVSTRFSEVKSQVMGSQRDIYPIMSDYLPSNNTNDNFSCINSPYFPINNLNIENPYLKLNTSINANTNLKNSHLMNDTNFNLVNQAQLNQVQFQGIYPQYQGHTLYQNQLPPQPLYYNPNLDQLRHQQYFPSTQEDYHSQEYNNRTNLQPFPQVNLIQRNYNTQILTNTLKIPQTTENHAFLHAQPSQLSHIIPSPNQFSQNFSQINPHYQGSHFTDQARSTVRTNSLSYIANTNEDKRIERKDTKPSSFYLKK